MNRLIVSIASGKGGTGKTTVAANLVKALNNDITQAIDCDVEEPNLHLFLKPNIFEKQKVSVPIPEIDKNKCTYCKKCSEVCNFNAITVVSKEVIVFPELCHGCGACSLFCPEGAIKEVDREVGTIETGHVGKVEFVRGILNPGEVLAPAVISEAKARIEDKKNVIIDSPPGTSCPVIEAVKGTDFVLLVTEPTPFGLNDLKLAVAMCRKIGVPFGIVINRWGIGNNDVTKFAREEKISLLLKIPYKKEFARCYARGKCIVDEFPEWMGVFRKLWNDIREDVRK
jgi:MinD superfamily P-loop ATPase